MEKNEIEKEEKKKTGEQAIKEGCEKGEKIRVYFYVQNNSPTLFINKIAGYPF